jgi:L-serine dehydratase
VLGLLGEESERVDTDAAPARAVAVRAEESPRLVGHHRIDFDESTDLILRRRRTLPGHPNSMRPRAWTHDGTGDRRTELFLDRRGFVLDAGAVGAVPTPVRFPVPHRERAARPL